MSCLSVVSPTFSFFKIVAVVAGLLLPVLVEVAGAVVTGKRQWWPPDISICARRISYSAVVQ